jgi:hypothetical protein
MQHNFFFQFHALKANKYKLYTESVPRQIKGDCVMIHLVMRAGRSNKSKQAFYRQVAENLATNPGIPTANMLITMTENRDIDWSFRDGLAQLVI